jgi:hypothetical protein
VTLTAFQQGSCPLNLPTIGARRRTFGTTEDGAAQSLRCPATRGVTCWRCNVRFEHARYHEHHDDGNFPGFVSSAHASVANAENDRKPAGERGLFGIWNEPVSPANETEKSCSSRLIIEF